MNDGFGLRVLVVCDDVDDLAVELAGSRDPEGALEALVPPYFHVVTGGHLVFVVCGFVPCVIGVMGIVGVRGTEGGAGRGGGEKEGRGSGRRGGRGMGGRRGGGSGERWRRGEEGRR